MLVYVYGFVRVCSEGGFHGKESDVQLFGNWEERNRIMYFDYSETFDNMSMEGIIGDTDANGNTKLDEQEFMQKMRESKDMEHDVFGLIQAGDYHVQYEPFAKCVN